VGSGIYSDTELVQLREEVKQDLQTCRHMKSILTRRCSEVRVRASTGVICSEFLDFAGTTAIRATLELSIIQMEYMMEALETRLNVPRGELVSLVQEEEESK
jgi:hypothetical protein